MRLALMSDLHCEFEKPGIRKNGHPDRGPRLEALKKVRPDILVLAGDIEVGPRMVLDYVTQVSEFLKIPIIYVAGNHEFYKGDITSDLEELRLGFSAARSAGHKLHFLEREAVVIDGVRFIGATLWTDYALFGEERISEAMSEAMNALNDHRLITIGNRRFTPSDALRIHGETKIWLQQKLAQPHDGVTVVTTHHAPARGSIAPKYQGDLISAAYVSDLSDLILQYRPVLWLHGHVHDSFDYWSSSTRIVTNPRGYPMTSSTSENTAFHEVRIIKV